MNPMLILAVVATGLTAALLTLLVYQQTAHPLQREDFDKSIAFLISIDPELNLNSALLSNAKQKITWNEWWAHRFADTGRKLKNPEKVGVQVLITALIAAVFGVVAFPGGPIGVFLGVLAISAIYGWTGMEASKRAATIEKQMMIMLTSLRASLSAGLTTEKALVNLATEVPAPLGDELACIPRMLPVGHSISETLNELSSHIPSQEGRFLISAIRIALSHGADLVPQLDVIAIAMEEKLALKNKLKSAVTSVRPVAWIYYIMVPLIWVWTTFIVNVPGWKSFWFSGAGLLMLGVIGILYSSGVFTMRQMVQGVEKG